MKQSPIHVGIGGWTFEPWRGVFFPKGLAHSKELEYAAERVTAIEINGTYYRTQTPASFVKWREATPPKFVFTVKASRFCTTRKVLAESGESIERFLGSGVTELGKKLGPILWQFMPTKTFEAEDFAAFLKLLPAKRDGVALRHALEVRHESFRTTAFIELARKHKAAVVFADSEKYPEIADVTGNFVYARLQNAQENVPTGYDELELKRWASSAKIWAKGNYPGWQETVTKRPAVLAAGREVFVFFINGAKVRAPAAAQAMIAQL